MLFVEKYRKYSDRAVSDAAKIYFSVNTNNAETEIDKELIAKAREAYEKAKELAILIDRISKL